MFSCRLDVLLICAQLLWAVQHLSSETQTTNFCLSFTVSFALSPLSPAICPLTVTRDPLQHVQQICSPQPPAHILSQIQCGHALCSFYSFIDVLCHAVTLASPLLITFMALSKWSYWGKLHPPGTPGSLKQTLRMCSRPQLNNFLLNIVLTSAQRQTFDIFQTRLHSMKQNTITWVHMT